MNRKIWKQVNQISVNENSTESIRAAQHKRSNSCNPGTLRLYLSKSQMNDIDQSFFLLLSLCLHVNETNLEAKRLS